MTKKLIAFLSTLATALASQAAPVQTVPVSDFLYAIRQVETGNRYDAPVGLHGELGAYQFRREVWFQHTREPFSEARTAFADEIAARHYQWITNQLLSAGKPVTAWNLAAAWNSGVVAVNTGHIPRSTRDYANRVRNLMQSQADLRRALTPHYVVSTASDIPEVALKPVEVKPIEVHAPLTPHYSIFVAGNLPIAIATISLR